ncbi:MAG: helix-turn-helix domain-containing protein [Ruminococcus sp.]
MNRITKLRKEKGISQIALAMELNVSQKTISAYENGKSEPSISMLKHMAEVFNTSVDYIINYTNIRTPIDKIAERELSKEESELINIYRSLPQKQQYVALGVIMGLKNGNN